MAMRKRPFDKRAALPVVVMAVTVVVLMGYALRAGGDRGSGASDTAASGESGNASPDAAPLHADAGGLGEDALPVDDGEPEDVLGPRLVTLLGEGVSRRLSDESLDAEARDILEDYQGQDSCVLADAGYLDLRGRVWSCTVMGDGWLDVVIVRAREAEGDTEVTTVRMDAADWERELAEGGEPS